MKYLILLPLCAVAMVTTSCKHKQASTNPYKNNPYYGPSSGSSYGGSTSGSSTYSSTSSGSYPSYSESTYSPPSTSAPASTSTYTPSAPSTPTYTQPSAPTYAQTSTTYTQPYSAPATSGGSSHTVARGENLYRIGLRYGTSVAAIKSANGLGTDTIYPGQVLRIP